MKFVSFSVLLPLAVIASATVDTADATTKVCLGDCTTTADSKTCVFDVSLDLSASETGYYKFSGEKGNKNCEGTNPTLGIEKGVTYKFVQKDLTNWYHPIGLAYYADGAHDDVDELEPGIPPPGTDSDCDVEFSCPTPKYMRDGDFLAEAGNPEDFGLDVYEPEFFYSIGDWASAGEYTVELNFDNKDFEDDIFYFCHIHQFMTGRMKFVDENGKVLTKKDKPEIPYSYETPDEYDQKCGTTGLSKFQLPNLQCPKKFVCDAPPTDGASGGFSDCIDSMNCAMLQGMTTKHSNTDHGDKTLFISQMIPHHENAVNMAKALMQTGDIPCEDITDDEDPKCQLHALALEIINVQNFQIQTMYGILDKLDEPINKDCMVPILSCKAEQTDITKPKIGAKELNICKWANKKAKRCLKTEFGKLVADVCPCTCAAFH